MGGTGKKICEKMMGKVRKRNEPASNTQWRTGNRKVIEGCRRSIKQNGGGKIMRIQSILLATAGLASLTCAQAARAKTAQSSDEWKSVGEGREVTRGEDRGGYRRII